MFNCAFEVRQCFLFMYVQVSEYLYLVYMYLYLYISIPVYSKQIHTHLLFFFTQNARKTKEPCITKKLSLHLSLS